MNAGAEPSLTVASSFPCAYQAPTYSFSDLRFVSAGTRISNPLPTTPLVLTPAQIFDALNVGVPSIQLNVLALSRNQLTAPVPIKVKFVIRCGNVALRLKALGPF